MIAFMAGHLEMPASSASEREDRCKTGSRQPDPFRNDHIHVVPLFAGVVYVFLPRRAKNQNGWFQDASTADCWTRPHGRFRKDEERRSPERENIKNPFCRFVQTIHIGDTKNLRQQFQVLPQGIKWRHGDSLKFVSNSGLDPIWSGKLITEEVLGANRGDFAIEPRYRPNPSAFR
jgi:hypothetical protein